MDDISAKLSEILNDPESMEQVRRMAEGLLSGNSEEKKQTDMPAVTDGIDMQKIVSIISRYKSTGNDARTKLLLALKPNLSPERQEKVDTAIKLMRMIELLPFLKESGILSI